jgi:predicted metal-dependent hydrolase
LLSLLTTCRKCEGQGIYEVVKTATPFRTTLPQQLEHRAGKVPVRVRVSRRAQRLALKIDAVGDAVELVLPPRTSLPRALNFLKSNRDWVERRFAALPPRITFSDGERVPVLGVPHRIRHVARTGAHGPVWIEAGEIRVSGEKAHIARRLRDFLRERARQEVGRRARRLALQLGRTVARVSVRDTTTRWGSCSANGNMAFSWRLVMAPEAVLHYVVAHEVAHLVEMNHGPRFWKLVDKLVPQVERQRAWLNDNRAWLLRIG